MSKRRVIYQLSLDTFLQVLNNQVAILWPRDTRVLSISVDHLRNQAELLCVSEEFDEVPANLIPLTVTAFHVSTKERDTSIPPINPTA